MNMSRSLLIAASVCAPMLVQAAEPASCKNVRFADVGWTDITVTTAVTSKILSTLGYKTKTSLISVPVTYKSLENKDIGFVHDGQDAEIKVDAHHGSRHRPLP